MSIKVLLWGSGCLMLVGGIGGTVVSLKKEDPQLTVLSLIFASLGFFLLTFLICTYFEEKMPTKSENYKTIAV